MLMMNATVAVFGCHKQAEAAVRMLEKEGYDIKAVSVVGRDYHTEDQVVAYYSTGDRMKYWGKLGAFWNDFWGLLSGTGFFWVPGFGPILVAGPLVNSIVARLDGGLLNGDLSAFESGLSNTGVPKDSILRCEAELKNGMLLLIVQGTPDEVRRAEESLKQARGARTIRGESFAVGV